MRRIFILTALASVGGFLFLYHWAESVRSAPDPRATLKVLDRQGILLAESQNPRFGRRDWVSLSAVSPALIDGVITQEDRHFYRHWGLDPSALARALWVNLRSGRFSQGGSTITQQTAKILLENFKGRRLPRTLFSKLQEALLAFDLELHETKAQILERYLNSVYLGHRLYGVEAASQAYFGKSSKDLSAGDAQFLAEHIRRPNGSGEILVRSKYSPIAPHLPSLFENVVSDSEKGPNDRVIPTTVDANIQRFSVEALRRELSRLRLNDPALQAAAVIIDVPTGELRGLVGSADFEDSQRGGEVNHAIALRQPGSTLKPFTYFLSFLHHKNPSQLVLDAPYHFYLAEDESYTPRNFDRRFHGVLSIREALANSYNVPAVLTLEQLGTAPYLDLLHHFGFSSLDQGPSYYGLALTLGSGSVRLTELTNAYAALARGGEVKPLKMIQGPGVDPAKASELPTPEEGRAAYYVTSILSDPDARRRAFGDAMLMNLDRQISAIKTGTSHDSRDAWAVGYTPRYAVGIWVGHTDNSPMPGLTGAEAAVPIWYAIMNRLHEGISPVAFARPAGIDTKVFCRDENCDVVKKDWDLSGSDSAQRPPQPEESLRILSPVDGDHFLLDPRRSLSRQKIFCEARVPEALSRSLAGPLRWILDGREIEINSESLSKIFLDLTPGRHDLRVALGDQKSRPVRITVSELPSEE